MEAAERVTIDEGGAGEARLAVGQLIGRYRVDEVLGVGGMGMVVRARDLELDRDVALKVAVAARDPVRDQRRAELLLREARAMARLQVREVRAVHDIGSANGIDYIAMAYVAGVDLARWLTTPRAGGAIVAAFVAAGRGLAAAHAAGVLHRDFKPSNVLIGDDGEVVVTDFGLSRWLHEVGAAEAMGTPRYRAPDAMGTPRYRAPDAEPDDPRADQYSFCASLGEAIAQAAPGTLAARTRRRIAAIVRRGTAAAPARYPSMAAVVAALETADGGHGAGRRWALGANDVADRAGRLGVLAGIEAAGRRRRAGRLGVLAAIVGVALAGAWWARPARSARTLGDALEAFADAPVDAALGETRALVARVYLRSARASADVAVALAASRSPGKRAAALYERGNAAGLDDDIAIARTSLEAAAQLADEARDDEVRAQALLGLFQLAASRGSDLHAADRAEGAAIAALARIQPARADRARLALFRAILAWKQGQAAAAARALAEGRAAVTPPGRDELLEWNELVRSQAGMSEEAGDRDAAIALLREAVATDDRIGGPAHVAAIGARNQLAGVLEAAARDGEAEAVMTELRRAGRTPDGARLLDEIVGPIGATRDVRIAVRDRAGAPVAGATVVAATQRHASSLALLGATSLYNERDRGVVTAVSDATGVATLAVRAGSRPWLAAEHATRGRAPDIRAPDVRAPAVRALDVRAPDAATGAAADVVLVLAPWATLTGRAPRDAALAITPVREPESPPIVLHAPDGGFASARVPEGAYMIAFCVDRGEVERCGARAAVVPAHEALELALPGGVGQLTVRPRDELARPIESSTVVLAPEGFAPADLAALWLAWPAAVTRRPDALIAWTAVHGSGAARFTDVPAGRYSLCAAAIHGDTEDPSFTARLEARGAAVPVFCTPITIGAAVIDRALVIPAAHRLWIGDGPDTPSRPRRGLRFR